VVVAVRIGVPVVSAVFGDVVVLSPLPLPLPLLLRCRRMCRRCECGGGSAYERTPLHVASRWVP